MKPQTLIMIVSWLVNSAIVPAQAFAQEAAVREVVVAPIPNPRVSVTPNAKPGRRARFRAAIRSSGIHDPMAPPFLFPGLRM